MQDGHVNAHNEMTTATFKVASVPLLRISALRLWQTAVQKMHVSRSYIHSSRVCKAVNGVTVQIAVEVILGFDDGLWFAEKEKEKVLKAWQTFLVGLFAAPFLWLKYIPGSGQ